MEEQFKNIDRSLEKIIKEAGIYKPSANFLNDVMSAVNQTAIKQEYKPLISKSVGLIIATLLATSFIMLLFYSHPNLSIFQDFKLFENISFKIPIVEFKFPKTLVYGIGFLGLFLIQIPFLKRYMEKSNS